MNLIAIKNLTKSFTEEPLFSDLNLDINSGDKIGLIGPNGAGKSTLIKILLGEEDPTSGKIQSAPNLNIGYIPQMLALVESGTIEDVLLAEFRPLQRELARLEGEMADPDKLEKALTAYQEVQESFDKLGGWEARDQAVSLLRRLGMEHHLETPVDQLSGGEQSLLFFARAMLGQPDLLILDEPGNHLDFLGLAWLEQFLKGYPGAVLVISHNRYLLDKVVSRIWHMERGNLQEWSGNYSSFRMRRTKDLLQQKIEQDKLDREIHQTQLKVNQLNNQASSSYNPPVQVMKMLAASKAKLEQLKEARGRLNLQEEQKITVKITGSRHRSDFALQIKDFSFSYPDKPLFHQTSFEVFAGEKAALLGANGSGKSTLIQAVMNQGDWDNPHLRLGPSTKVGYLGQDVQFTEEEGTILEEVLSWGPLSESQGFNLVAPYRFEYKDMGNPVATLSGGERQRLQLAKLTYLETNFLILDEPTNHLDIDSREILEECLQDYQGTLLMVSHDRYFLDTLAEKILYIRDKQIETIQGSFTEFFGKNFGSLQSAKGLHGRRKVKEHLTPEQLEAQITDWEEEKKELQKQITRLGTKGKEQEALKLMDKLAKVQDRLESAYSRWEQAAR